MAQGVNGKVYLVRTQTGAVANGSTSFQDLVCLTSNGWQAVDNSISTSSKCTDGWATDLQGERGWTMSGEGQAIPGSSTENTQASFHELALLWKNGTVFNVEMYNIGEPDDIIRGRVRITSLEFTAPNNDIATFSVTFTGQGEPFFTAAA